MRKAAALLLLLVVLACLAWLLGSGLDDGRTGAAHPRPDRAGGAVAAFEAAGGGAEDGPAGRVPATSASPPGAGPPSRSAHGRVALHFRVLDGNSLEPVADAGVVVRHRAETALHQTDSGGRFALTVRAPVTVELQYAELREYRSRERVLEPRSIEIDPAAGADQEFDLALVFASRRVRVRVVEHDGTTPADDARVVVLDYAPSGKLPEKAFALRTPPSGVVQVPAGIQDGLPGLGLFADRRERNEVSELVRFRDWREVLAQQEVVLTLRDGGRVRVRASDHGGRPLPGAKVWVRWEHVEKPFASLMIPFTTDAEGVVELRGLGVGRHAITVRDPRSRESVQREVVLERGESRELDVAFAAKEQLAVAGTTLDEGGRPLGGVFLRFHLPGDESPWGTRSEADGSFALWLEPRPELTELTIDTYSSLEADAFEPERLTVPFGERGVVLRRTRVVEPRLLEFTVRDALTAVPVEGAEIWEYDSRLGEGDSRDWSDESGRAVVRMRLRPSSLWGVRAPGYLDAQGPLANVGTAVDVSLTPGTRRRWRIGHWYDGAPLPGARVVDPETGRTLATADEAGRVANDGVPWPPVFRVELAGFQASDWLFARRNGWEADFIGLRPVSQGGGPDEEPDEE